MPVAAAPSLDLGVPGFAPMAELDRERWPALEARLGRRIFLRSDGPSITVGAPHEAAPAMAATLREVCERFARFYRGAIAAYFERPELRGEYLLNPLVEPLLEIERAAPWPDPAHRFDAVLEPGGGVKIIENNSNGVCLFHYRSLLYLVRELDRDGQAAAAKRLDDAFAEIAAGFRRFYDAAHPAPRERPTIGCLMPREWLRSGKILFRAGFERHGFDFVHGGPEIVEVDRAGIRMAGRPIDLLWSDFLVYNAYQCERYLKTHFRSRVGRFDDSPEHVAALLADPRFLDHLRQRRVINLSPSTSYLGLPKLLLGWIHRADRPVPAADREFLARHVARTYAELDRREGALGRDEAVARRESLVLKPCQYGGSHGVALGREVTEDAWVAQLGAIWDDPTWVVQEFAEPVKTAAGDWLSLGLQSLGGRLGGVLLRTSPSATVSARDAAFIPAALPPG